ncbi:MAG: EAL domain-containing protein, partial [Desulfovibrionales bacterium]|nr:EAL domain-containing protein [Desulfovibrionales bacterium]
VGSGNLLRMVRKQGINPTNIVIEMVESRVRDFPELCRFINNHRKYGFLIALDDFGAGHSNLERISIIKPEIIKIDRSLIENVHNEFFKQEILKAIIKLTDQLGVMVLSEGVETREEVVKTLELDTDLLQGYYFSRPQPLEKLSIAEINTKIQKTASEFFKNVITRIKIRKEHFNNCQALGFSILSELKDFKDENEKLEYELKGMISSYSIIECAYLLDESGRQISSTVMNNGHIHNLKSSQLFRPAEFGDDHSLKDYYVYIQAGLDRFITDPYISLATGSLCRTISVTFTTRDNNKRILCLDMKENDYQ